MKWYHNALISFGANILLLAATKLLMSETLNVHCNELISPPMVQFYRLYGLLISGKHITAKRNSIKTVNGSAELMIELHTETF